MWRFLRFVPYKVLRTNSRLIIINKIKLCMYVSDGKKNDRESANGVICWSADMAIVSCKVRYLKRENDRMQTLSSTVQWMPWSVDFWMHLLPHGRNVSTVPQIISAQSPEGFRRVGIGCTDFQRRCGVIRAGSWPQKMLGKMLHWSVGCKRYALLKMEWLFWPYATLTASPKWW